MTFDLTAHIARHKLIDDTLAIQRRFHLERARMLPGRVLDERAYLDPEGRIADWHMRRAERTAKRDDWSMWISLAGKSVILVGVGLMSITLARVVYAVMTGAYQ